jgi:hypothetical protein
MNNKSKLRNYKIKFKNAVKLMQALTKIFNIKLVFAHDENQSVGFFHDDTKLIMINFYLVKTNAEVLSTFFHELSHFFQYEHKLFREFYKENPCGYKRRQLALRMELHADKHGEKMFKAFCKGMKYDRAYKTQHDFKYLKYTYRDLRYKNPYPEFEKMADY